MKPLSNTDTNASARGFSSPLTLIRIDAFRGSETSCIDFAMQRRCSLGGALATIRSSCRPGNRPSPAGLLDGIVAPVHQAVPPPRRIDVFRPLRRMPSDITYDLAHVRIVLVAQLFTLLAQDIDDPPAARMANALVPRSVRALPAHL